MMTVERIRELLKDMNLRSVAEKTGLHYNTVRAVANGKTNVMYHVISTLNDYLESRGSSVGKSNSVPV